MQASTLVALYDANAIRAEGYKGQKLIVRGTIRSIGRDILGSPYVMLAGSSNQYDIKGVHGTFNRSDASALVYLSVGQTILLGGTLNGKVITSVVMKDCWLAKPDQISEYADAPKRAAKKSAHR